MSQLTYCDGCGADLGKLPLTGRQQEWMITGERAPGSGIALRPLPDGRFDWCKRCALAAFKAVADNAADAVLEQRGTPDRLTRRDRTRGERGTTDE